MYVLNVMKWWLKIVFPVIGALNGSIDPVPRFKKGTLSYVIMKMLHFFCYRCLPDVSKALSLYNTYSKLDVEFEKRFQSMEDKFHKGIGHHLTKCFEAANLAALEDTCKKLQTSVKDLSTKIVTGFTKRGLPHTSNSMNLEAHNFVFKKRTNLKFSLAIKLCWHSQLTYFQVNNLLYFNLWIDEVGKLDVCRRPLFANPVTINDLSTSSSNLQMEIESTSVSLNPTQSSAAAAPPAGSALSIIDELADHDRRKKNMIVYNLPEPAPNKSDSDSFTAMCSSVFNGPYAITKSVRLGKKLPNKHKPLLLCLEQEEDKLTLLSRCYLLRHNDSYKNVFLAPDRTRFEREKHKKLLSELKHRRSQGEVDLIIRNGAIITKPARGNTATHNSVPTTNQHS